MSNTLSLVIAVQMICVCSLMIDQMNFSSESPVAQSSDEEYSDGGALALATRCLRFLSCSQIRVSLLRDHLLLF